MEWLRLWAGLTRKVAEYSKARCMRRVRTGAGAARQCHQYAHAQRSGDVGANAEWERRRVSEGHIDGCWGKNQQELE